MPSLYNLNSQPHPFWDFIASLDEAPSSNQAPNQRANQQNTVRTAEESSKKKPSDKQPTVEDEVAAEPSSQEKGKTPEATGQPSGENEDIPFRGRGRCGGNGAARRGPVHGRRGGRGVFGEPYHHNPPGEGFDGFGDFNPFSGLGFFGPQHRGPSPPHGPPGTHRGPHPHHNRAEPCHPPHSHHHHGRGPRGGPNNFNLGEFLSTLGSRLGLDLSGAAEGLGLGLDQRAGSTIPLVDGVDFEPRADIFDTPPNFLIHLSLPGAKKEDLGVEWDGENSTLRIGGVVHRPGVDEETLKLLAVDGRKKEVGVFEKKIHLGTKRDPAKIDVAGISAKMTDGVLVVKVPKVEVQHVKREVRISGSESPSPVRQEKEAIASPAPAVAEKPVADKAKGKEVATVAEMDVDYDNDEARSETEKGDDEMEYADDPAEQLPEYKEEPVRHDEDEDEEEDEGDYVKIDVK